MSRYVELNKTRGKIFSEIIYDLSLTSPVDNTVDIRINASPTEDTITNENFLRKNFHMEQVAIWCEVILTNILREMGCNDVLFHCLR